MPVPKIDEFLGIGVYATETSGISGIIKQSVDDFMVEEVLVDGSKAQIEKAEESPALGASVLKQRYLLCVLVKRNWDMFKATNNIGKQLNKSQKQVQFAGIKDAKAVTAQYVTIDDALMDDAEKANVKDIALRPVGYIRHELSTYYLLGNSFTIKIKDIPHSESTIRERIGETMKELEVAGGIPNFFGHQRFGTTRPITHLVGKAIVKGDFGKAAMIFLAKPSVHEHPSSRQARRELQSTRDFKQALKNFPKQLRYERLMLVYLVEKPDDFVGAFRQLPIKLQSFFVQAYQSYLFNRFLTERIKNGVPLNKVEIGDWVVGIERSGLPMVKMARLVNKDNLTEIADSLRRGKVRVALPIVGCKHRLSQSALGQAEKQILQEEGVRTENFRISGAPTMGARGGMRAVVAPATDFKLLDVSASVNSLRRHKATLGFVLLRGCYATVLLREMMKPRNPIVSGF